MEKTLDPERRYQWRFSITHPVPLLCMNMCSHITYVSDTVCGFAWLSSGRSHDIGASDRLAEEQRWGVSFPVAQGALRQVGKRSGHVDGWTVPLSKAGASHRRTPKL